MTAAAYSAGRGAPIRDIASAILIPIMTTIAILENAHKQVIKEVKMNKKILALCSILMVLTVFMLTACASKATSSSTQSTVVVMPAGNQKTETTQSSSAQLPGVPPSGNPPSGSPPSGSPPGGAGGSSGGSSADQGLASATGAYTVNGQTETQMDQTYTASNDDQSAVYVINGGNLSLSNATITSTGNTSSNDYSSFYGLNAAVLATSGCTISLDSSSVTTSGTGANGVFATGSGSTVTLSNVTITATGDGGHGAMASDSGSLNLDSVDITTSGAHSAPIATDRGGGTITVSGGTVFTSGTDSPCLYSTGSFTVEGMSCTATGSESAVIEGANSITLTDTELTSSVENKWGVMIYQSMSGDAQGTEGTFKMNSGTLANTAATGPLFFVTNSTAYITLSGVNVNVASGTLVEAGGTDRWGTSGSNGGSVNLIADSQTLTGNFVTDDDISSIIGTFQNESSLTGAINNANNSKEVNLYLDATSTWTVTADSYLTCLNDAGGISGSSVNNITGNGHTVYYKSSACNALAGQTYTLNEGGYLKPSK